jgi:putative heme iron utilization protein
LASAEREIVEHMNRDHAEAMQLCARNLLRLDGDGWSMTGIDAEGVDLRRGGRVARLHFSRQVHDAGAARSELVRLTTAAREAR